MKILKLEGDAVAVTEAGAADAQGNPTSSVWTMRAEQLEKHRPQFAAEIDALPQADRDRLAVLRAPIAKR